MALHRVVPFPEEAIAGSWLQNYIDQGRDQGRAEGEAEFLLRLLRRRFGALSPDVEDRVRSASSDDRDRWLDSLDQARDVAALLGTDGAH